jgi:DNA-binding MarR family transcriptional regulator
MLGRKLMKIADAALPKDSDGRTPTSVRMIVFDVSEHPGSSIGEITERTGFPQSHVSTAVARLRAIGALETYVDPNDGRRTLVTFSPGFRDRVSERASVSADGPLAEALANSNPGVFEQVQAALDVLSEQLTPRTFARFHPELNPRLEAP